MNTKYILFTMVLLVVFTPLSTIQSIQVVEKLPECHSFYFLNGIIITNSTINETLYLETPRNTSLTGGFIQSVTPILAYNTVLNESSGVYVFNVSQSEEYEGFFIVRVEICYKNSTQSLAHLIQALEDPRYDPFNETYIPEYLVKQYIREPYSRVVEVIVPAYEDWINKNYNISISSMSKLGLLSTSAFFVYNYIEYNASALPRTLDEVIKDRKGDCDDISRILVNLLHYYGIPAVIVSGYVFINGFEISIPLENVTYVFNNNGPHAYVMAYLPGYGWISLDYLAGSMLMYPFIIDGYTIDTSVQQEAVEEVVEFHRKINGTQVIAVYTENEFRKIFGEQATVNKTLEYLYVKAGIKKQVGGQSNTTTPTIIPTTTPTPTTKPTTSTTPTTTTHYTPSQTTQLQTTEKNETTPTTTMIKETNTITTPSTTVTNRETSILDTGLILLIAIIVAALISILVILIKR